MYTLIIDGEKKEYPSDITYEDVAKDYQHKYDSPIVAVSLDGKIRELFKKVSRNGELKFFTLADTVGHQTYIRSTVMLFMKAVYDLYGEEITNKVRSDFTIGRGLFINTKDAIEPTQENAEKIKKRMHEVVDAGTPYMKRQYPLDDAMDIFSKRGMEDKVKLFKYRRTSSVNIYEMEGYRDYYYGYMVPNASYIKYFDVVAYDIGFMLMTPAKNAPTVIPTLEESRLLYDTFQRSHDWCVHVGIENVGDLNERICTGHMEDLILVQEAEQERRIAEIAAEIASRKDVKFVMIAGPSSSGKTSFSHRLSVQLRTFGLKPHAIGLDDYFVNREDTPLDENGNYNFECIEAIDTKGFNDDMLKLLDGERIEMPTFNFKIGRREYQGNFMQLEKDDILVIEGIHGLNPKMSYALPDESKFKIYISALTSINIDQHNRIPTTDARLLRRLVRDARTRGSDAHRTLSMWASVRRGEEENIFPFQEEADVMFNSAQVYELALLKQFAEPLLFSIQKDDPTYHEAKRLLKFLDYFLSLPSEFLPNNSICREFVGGSCFNV